MDNQWIIRMLATHFRNPTVECIRSSKKNHEWGPVKPKRVFFWGRQDRTILSCTYIYISVNSLIWYIYIYIYILLFVAYQILMKLDDAQVLLLWPIPFMKFIQQKRACSQPALLGSFFSRKYGNIWRIPSGNQTWQLDIPKKWRFIAGNIIYK